MTAGGIGAFVGTPAEISLIRMTADGRWFNKNKTFLFHNDNNTS